MSRSERHHLLEHFKRYASPRAGSLMQMMRELPAEDVERLVGSLTAVFSPEPSPWDDWYIGELERLFDQAETALDPFPILAEMDAFGGLGDMTDGPLQQRIRAVLLAKLRSEQVYIRYRALTLLPHFVSRRDEDLIQALAALRYDPRWKVRIKAFELLNAIRGVSRYTDMPYLEQILLRAKEWFDEL